MHVSSAPSRELIASDTTHQIQRASRSEGCVLLDTSKGTEDHLTGTASELADGCIVSRPYVCTFMSANALVGVQVYSSHSWMITPDGARYDFDLQAVSIIRKSSCSRRTTTLIWLTACSTLTPASPCRFCRTAANRYMTARYTRVCLPAPCRMMQAISYC